MGNRKREAFGVRRLAGAFDGNLPTPTTSTPLSLASWAIEGAKRLECAGLPALSTVNQPPLPGCSSAHRDFHLTHQPLCQKNYEKNRRPMENSAFWPSYIYRGCVYAASLGRKCVRVT